MSVRHGDDEFAIGVDDSSLNTGAGRPFRTRGTIDTLWTLRARDAIGTGWALFTGGTVGTGGTRLTSGASFTSRTYG